MIKELSSEKEIEKNVKAIIAGNFKLNVDRDDDLYLLGLKPRDVVRLVYLIEEKYDIQFGESELIQCKFNMISNIVSAIRQHMSN